jgi:hypothetical protein
MNVRQAYEKYMTPKNLQEHMLRVTALSKIIIDNWTGQTIDKFAIIKICALHDITKPVTFDTSKAVQAKYGMSQEDISNLGKLKKFIKENLGTDEHKAAVEMCRDMNLGEKVVKMMEDMEWKYAQRLLDENNLESLIPIYCDMRIGPKGMMDLLQRVSNLKGRVGDRKEYDYEEFERSGKILEQKIQENVGIDLKLVTNDQLDSLFEELLNLKI